MAYREQYWTGSQASYLNVINAHCTRINGISSAYLSVGCGVPQGSILGPLLFSIFINDLVKACHLSKPYLFADDGALYFEDICRTTYLNIRLELLNVKKWLDLNKLSLNIGKTNYLVFDNLDYNDCIYLEDNSVIEECKVVKYLGLIVDNKLSFSDHIDYVKKKVTKRIGAMYRCKNLLPLKFRKMFANALMLPQFDYLDTIYSKSCKTKKKNEIRRRMKSEETCPRLQSDAATSFG